jgi:endonuclease/exonuclease/phosphatase family metal-dependent hydrolase
MALEMLTYNVQYGRNKSIEPWLRRKEPAVYCLQEFPEAELNKFSPEYKKIFAASFSKGGAVYGELIGYKPEIQLNTAFGVELGKMNIPGFISKAEGRRTALIAGFNTPDGELIVGNIHLEWFSKDSYKVAQLKKVLESINQAFPDHDPSVVLAGDYNFSSFFSGNGLRAFATQKGFAMIERHDTHTFFGLPHQVDYVSYKNCEVENVRTEDTGFSDHKPILFTVTGIFG